MENYDILLNEINEYLKCDEIDGSNANNELISAYDLYNIVNDELEGLRNITINSKINKKLRSINIFKNLSSEIRGDKNKSIIMFKKYIHSFDPFDDWEYTFEIYKDKNINDIYFEVEKNHHNKAFYKFVKKNYNLIIETLQTIENYIELLNTLSHDYIEICDDLFNVQLTYNICGEVDYEISIRSDHCLSKEYSKKWYQKENICDYANKHAEEILKRIPVSPYELKEPFKKIYYNHKEKNNTDVKVKSLRIFK